MSKIHREIFDPNRQKVFDTLHHWKNEGYLAGGTSLALQLGHRTSYDFDIFIPKPLSRHLIKKSSDIFGKDITIRLSSADFLMFETAEHISLNFVYYWFPLLTNFIPTTSIPLASLEDIAADKAHTIGRRAQWRDYVDLFYILKNQFLTLDTIIKNAQKKFAPEFNTRLFLEQLTYWDDIDDFSIKFLQKPYKTEEIQTFLQNISAQELKRWLK